MKKNSHYNIYFADFETLTQDSKDFKLLNHTDVFLTYIESLNNDKGQMHYNLNDFMKFILNLNESSLIYFHNLSFDGDFIIKWLIKNFDGEFFNPLLGKPKRLKYFEIFNQGNKIYSIHIKNIKYIKGKKKKINIVFKCTYNLFNTSIESLGKSIGKNKKDEFEELKAAGICENLKDFYDLGGFNMDEKIRFYFEKYIKKDVKIAKQTFINFENELYNNHELIYSKKYNRNCLNIRNELTIGRIVYKLSFNSIYNNYDKYLLKKYRISSEEYDRAKKFYYGGFTQFNDKYHNKWLSNLNIVCLDINSSYPYQMTKLLPVGALYDKINPEWKEHLEYFELDIEEAIIKPNFENFPCLKNWTNLNNERYVKILFNFKCYYAKQEFEFLQKIYDFKIKTKKVYYAEAAYPLKPLIDILYKYKETATLKGDAGKKQTYKIMLNSLYGTQCMRKKYNSIWYVYKNDYENLKQKWLKNKNLTIEINEKEYSIEGFKNDPIYNSKFYGVYVSPIKDKKAYPNILIGAQITSYARLQLWEAIYNIGIENWYYSDTDSIFVKNLHNLSNIIEFDKSKLGAWSKEDFEFNNGKILGAKRYIFTSNENNKVKFGFSGVDVDVNKFDFKRLFNDKETLYNSQIVVKRDEFGTYFDFRDYNLKVGSQ